MPWGGVGPTVEITSRDYWFKVVEMLQQNWALVDADDTGGVTVFFVDDRSGVFDQMSFPSSERAATALARNGFRRLAHDPHAQQFLAAPTPPFKKSVHPNGAIYSSGRYWR